MPLEVRTAGCIAYAFNLREEFNNQGEVIYVFRPVDHAYLRLDNGGVLNTGESGFCDVPNFTGEELLSLIESGQAIVLAERPPHRRPLMADKSVRRLDF